MTVSANKRKRQSTDYKYEVREHADDLPDEWRAVLVKDLPIANSSWINLEPKRSAVLSSGYWIGIQQ